jgi:hypothetical protein
MVIPSGQEGKPNPNWAKGMKGRKHQRSLFSNKNDILHFFRLICFL